LCVVRKDKGKIAGQSRQTRPDERKGLRDYKESPAGDMDVCVVNKDKRQNTGQ
jgi:hypothetical protein